MSASSHRITTLLPLLLLVTGAGSCATTEAGLETTPPLPIDLKPRCEPELEGLAAGAPLRVADDPRASFEVLPRGARWLSIAAPTSPLEALAWGFPTRGPHGRLVAALLQAAETSRDPRALRDEVLDLGASMSAEVEGDWLWLELRFPPGRRTATLRSFERWLDVQPPAPEAFERIRRGVAIATLADQASATLPAERLFCRLHPAVGCGSKFAEADEIATPASVAELASATLKPESSVILHVSSGGEEAVRRVRDEIVGWIEHGPLARRSSAPAAALVTDVQAAPNDDGAIHIIDRPNSPQVELLVGFPSVEPDHPDASALQMLASLLGSDVGGRLFRDLRERQGLAYIITASQEAEARFAVSTRARPGRVAALLAGIEAHLRALVEVPILPCEVRMLVDRMTGEAALAADDASKLAGRWRSELARSNEFTPLSERVSAFRRASDRGLDAVAQRTLAGRPTVVLVGDAKPLRRELARAFPGRPLFTYDEALEPR